MENCEIKHEFRGDSKFCHTCLSVGRKLRPLQDLESFFAKITLNYHKKDPEAILICWQCSSLLRKVALFQEQVQKADELMMNNQCLLYGIPLSNLTSVTLSEIHETIYLVEENIHIKENTHKNNEEIGTKETLHIELNEKLNDSDLENTERDFELKKNTKSRWAIKKSQQNKKPKFKVCTDYDKSFKRIQVNTETFHKCIEREKNTEYFKSKKFKCVNCVLVFNSQNKLEKHHKHWHNSKEDKEDSDINFDCKIKDCEKRHLLSNKKHYLYKCSVCEFVCQYEMRSWHFQKDHKKIFQCLKCHLQFGSRKLFYKHHKEWHEKFVCHHCGISFKMRYCIKDHLRKQHSPFTCVPCNKSFARYNGLWLHKKITHALLSHHPHKHNWDLYRRTPKKIRIPCTACDKVYTKNIYMKDHYNLVHLKVFKYRCESCDKNFVRNADLVKHTRKIHEGILPLKNKMCHICGKGFTTNKILSNHVKTHSSQRNTGVDASK